MIPAAERIAEGLGACRLTPFSPELALDDWRLVMERWSLVLLLLILPVLFKAALVTVLARGLGATEGVSLRTGLSQQVPVEYVAPGCGLDGH